jgi:hypothetical protein
VTAQRTELVMPLHPSVGMRHDGTHSASTGEAKLAAISLLGEGHPISSRKNRLMFVPAIRCLSAQSNVSDDMHAVAKP